MRNVVNCGIAHSIEIEKHIKLTNINFMNKSQTIGIGIIIVGIIAYLLDGNSIIQTASGVLCAIGLGFIFKWIPFKKQNSTE